MKNCLVQVENAFEFIRNGKSIKQNGDEGLPITRIETIAKGSVDIKKMGYAGINSLAGFEKYQLEVGDILMSHINSEKHLGKTALFQEVVPVIHGMNLLCLRTKKNLNSKFAIYFFRTNLFKGQLSKITKKSVNQASFNVSGLKSLKIPLPPLETQKQIVDLLDRAQALIDKRKEQIALMDQLIQSLFYDMFGDPVTNPMGWKRSDLASNVQLITKGSSPKWQGFQYVEKGIRFITSENVLSGYVDITKDKFVPEEFNKKLLKSQLEDGDILINIVGASAGRAAIVTPDLLPANINQAVSKITLKSKAKIKHTFLLHMLNEPHFNLELLGAATESARLNISLTDLRTLQVICPPITLQENFAKRIQQIEAQKEAMTASLQELENNFSSIMQRAFKGEL
jgi:type I restriction enzyme S subunit